MKIITDQDVRSTLKMEEAIRVVESALIDYSRGDAKNLLRHTIKADTGTFRTMSASIPRMNVVGSKQGFWTSPDTRAEKQTVISGETTTLYDIQTGEILALINSHYLNEARTGAAGGVAVKILANQDAQTVGLIGSGLQARTQLLAVLVVRKIKSVKVYSRSKENREQFCRRMQDELDADVAPVSSSKEAVESSDIVIEATSSTSPVFDGKQLSQGCHVTAIGTGYRGARTLDDETVRRAAVVSVSSKEQVLIDGVGDILYPIMARIIQWRKVVEISDIVARNVPGRLSQSDITVCKLNGMALYDIAVGKLIYDSLR